MHYLYTIYAFIFGTLIGSFLNVVILRLPEKKDLVLARSACPTCSAQLKWFHNIPVLSFLFLKGKCAFCSTKISWQYPLVELLVGFIAYGLFPDEVTVRSLGLYFFYFSIACIFICHIIIDLKHHLLLDSLNLYLLVVIFAYSVLTYHWSFWLWGAAIGFGSTLLVTWLFYKIRGQIGLGGGDIKLFGILGLFLGPVGIVHNIFLSCFMGAVIGIVLIGLKKIDKTRPIPFGPFIILTAAFQIYFPGYYYHLQSWIL